MEKSDIQLTGNNQEQVIQFLDLLKSKTITKEQLAQIIPLTSDFINCLGDTLKKEAEEGLEKHKRVIERIERLIDILDKLCTKIEVTPEERIKAIEAIEHISDSLTEIEKHQDDNEHWTKRLLAILGVIVLIPVVILAAGVSEKK